MFWKMDVSKKELQISFIHVAYTSDIIAELRM